MIFMTIVMTSGKIAGRNIIEVHVHCNGPPTFYAHSTHLASYSFIGYNIRDTLIMLNVVPLSLRIMGVVLKSGCG